VGAKFGFYPPFSVATAPRRSIKGSPVEFGMEVDQPGLNVGEIAVQHGLAFMGERGAAVTGLGPPDRAAIIHARAFHRSDHFRAVGTKLRDRPIR
jgi:hypothetical protein